MTSSVELATPTGTDCGCVSLPVNPWLSNHYHFGMLLGVDDLETDQGYHRGKTWLHTAWLHGGGTVWGLGVSLDAEHREIVVDPGLAMTGAGRELHLDRRYCVDVAAWLAAADPETVTVEVDGSVRRFTVHVVAGPRQCLDRAVPAIAEPCGGGNAETAYSRSVEAIRLELVPGEPDPLTDPFPRTRAFLGLGPADGDLATAVTDAHAAIGALPSADQGAASVTWLRRFAADDVIARTPAPSSLFPRPDDDTVLLATVHVVLDGDGAAAVLVVDGEHPSEVAQRDRPVLLPTGLIQDLVAAGAAPGGAVAADDGPRADPATLSGAEVRFAVDAALDPLTVVEDAFTVTTLAATGWEDVTVDSVALEDADTTVVLTLDQTITDQTVRVVVAGTGPRPVLGADGRPVAGVRGGPPAGPDDGHDIVLMMRS